VAELLLVKGATIGTRGWEWGGRWAQSCQDADCGAGPVLVEPRGRGVLVDLFLTLPDAHYRQARISPC